MYPDFEMGGLFLVFWLIYMLFLLGINIAAYVCKALGMYTIAKRRGIQKPWLAWIPVAEMWTLGCISDQYQYVVKGKVKNKRKSLLTLNILMWVSYIAFFVAYAVFFVQLFLAMGTDPEMMPELNAAAIGAVIWMLVLALVMFGFAVAVLVIQYMALYDLYRSCDPDNGGLYLVLSIFFSIALPILVFICRKKDLGMPPRREEVPQQIPQTEAPWEN